MMRILGKLKELIFAALMVLGGIIILANQEYGLMIVMLILGISLIVSGVGYLIYFFTMARHMVGGKAMLFIGMLLMELGAFTGSMINIPKSLILIYLALTYVFSGAIDVLRALESKQNLSPSWKMKLSFGIGNILVAILCFVSIFVGDFTLYVYSGGLFFAAITRVIRAFVKTDDVYIQA